MRIAAAREAWGREMGGDMVGMFWKGGGLDDGFALLWSWGVIVWHGVRGD